MDYEQFEAILKESRQFIRPEVEKNIFSIGGHGHYENPISDILAFFLDSHEVHGFGDLVLKSLNEAVKEVAKDESAGFPNNDTDIIKPPSREVYTDDAKRIDILIETQSYVLIIENKIRHWLANPFDSYNAYLDKYYKDKTKYRFLLSIRKETPPDGWVSLTYKDFLNRIKINLGEYVLNRPYSKWIVLFREFILNIEQECEHDPMDDEKFEFISKNYGAIQDLQKMADEYLNELHKKALDAIRLNTDDDSVSGRREFWRDEGIALYLYRKDWGGKTCIILCVTPEGLYWGSFCIYDILNNDEAALKASMNDDGKYKEGRKKDFFEFYFVPENLDATLKEIEVIAIKLNAYYGKLTTPATQSTDI